MDSYDLAIIGGGIGGSALATVMANAGRKVLVLEQSDVFEDHVRGEWIAPWGVVEVKRVGLYDLLKDAGGHHLQKHITYDENLPPELAEAAALPLDSFLEGIPGPLCIGHPKHCQTLFDAAGAAGAETYRGVRVISVEPGAAPRVTYVHDGEERTVQCRLIVGADGRASMVRKAAGIDLQQDRPHHMFGGMLVEEAPDWDDSKQAIGTEGNFAFLAFPQGDGRIRIYGSYSLDERQRFAGEDGRQRFLDAFRMRCSPENRHIADSKPAGPLRSYFNINSWTDEPFAEGVVLIGDAAGWNDPITGQGLSITYRDVRIVSEFLKENDAWTPALFAPYAEERSERMRRLRFCSGLQSRLDAEFDDEARERRRRYFERAAADPTLGSHAIAVMAGPENLPAEFFTDEHWARVIEG